MHAASGIGFYFYTASGRAHSAIENHFDVYPFCSCVLQIIGVWLMPPLARLKTFALVWSCELAGILDLPWNCICMYETCLREEVVCMHCSRVRI